MKGDCPEIADNASDAATFVVAITVHESCGASRPAIVISAAFRFQSVTASACAKTGQASNAAADNHKRFIPDPLSLIARLVRHSRDSQRCRCVRVALLTGLGYCKSRLRNKRR